MSHSFEESIEKHTAGSVIIDALLGGGYETRIITTIYGPSSTGKTCLCILAAIEALKLGKKVVYIDTEGGFSIDRALQLDPGFAARLDNFLFFKPTSFLQQKQALENVRSAANQFGLIIVDSIAMFYRLEASMAANYSDVNRDLNIQLIHLLQTAREQNIPVLITDQVYANLENRNEVIMVGGDLLKYTSKCVIELKKQGKFGKAILKKHRSLPEGKSAEFLITANGISVPEA